MSRSKNRKIADLISGTTFDDGVVAASEVTGLATVATSGSFSDLSNQPTPFDPSTLGTASTQATGAFATAAQGTTADAALPKAGGTMTGVIAGFESTGIDDNANATAITIDSSENVLVGKTSANNTDVGTTIYSTLGFSSTRSGGVVGILNRTANDGDIIQFRRGGTTSGSIGVVSGNRTYINSQGGDGYLYRGGSSLYAWGGSNFFATTDNSKDLGVSNYRWKDGFFSGTVNAANFNTTSDATLKTNVETLTGSLDKVKSLRGVSYDWIESGGSEIGVIAQEVEAVIPDVVSTNDEGIKSVKYGNMVAVLIEAIKEQQVQIDELKAQLNS